MNYILLSGGSGKRLWPLSNDSRSKQFIKMFRAEGGGYESMLQRVYRSIAEADDEAVITIAAPKNQVSAIRNQLGADVNICVEPCRRDTFPAIVLATAYLKDVCQVAESEPVVVCPVDPYVGEEYFEALKRLGERAAAGFGRLVLMGIEPLHPAEKYGYIIPKDEALVSRVSAFKEKPDEAAAREYIARGALWNAGVFAYKLSYVLEKSHGMIDYKDYGDLLSKYASVQKISFDYAVVEKEPDIEVMRFGGQWKDLGTWNTLTESLDDCVVGKGIIGETCSGVHIVNELEVPVLALGLKDVVISASPQGILVSDKESSSGIKPYVESIDSQIMYAEKSWGSFRVIDVDEFGMTLKVCLKEGRSMSYHSHMKRDEVWVILDGTGTVTIDGCDRTVRAGDTVTIKAHSVHTIAAKEALRLIEVQLGADIDVHDKIKNQ